MGNTCPCQLVLARVFTASKLRRPILLLVQKYWMKRTIKGRAFYQDALPLIIPSSYVLNNSDHKGCQQCSTRGYVPINATHFSAHGAGSFGMVRYSLLIRTVLTSWHPCRQTNSNPSLAIPGGGVHRGGRLCL